MSKISLLSSLLVYSLLCACTATTSDSPIASNEPQPQQGSEAGADQYRELPPDIFDIPVNYQQPVAITVHKTPTCGCCGLWTEHLRKNGFEIHVVDHEDLSGIKARLGVPASMNSCHTAEVNGLFVEGHVPARDIRKMIDMAPHAAAAIKGVGVPGMPIGSPGMEVGTRVDQFDVLVVDEGGQTMLLSRYGKK